MTEVNPIKLAGCIQGELAELCPESTIEVTYHELCLRHTLNAMTEEERAAVQCIRAAAFWDKAMPDHKGMLEAEVEGLEATDIPY